MSSVLGNVINTNGNKVYALSANKAQFEFVEEALKDHKSIRKSNDFKNRLELIQDFHFSTSSGKIRVTKDGNYIGACGTYPPDLKIFECEELSMKLVRRVDCEIADFQFVSDDYQRIVILGSDRTLEFHSKGGRHHKLRIPAFGRSMSYDEYTSHLSIATNTNQVYRLDLEEGAFLTPLTTSMSDNNVIQSGLHHKVIFVGGDTGMEVWDTRTCETRPVYFVSTGLEDTLSASNDDVTDRLHGVTSIAVKDTGFLMATGSAAGICRVYDVRDSEPLITKDHAIDAPIVDMTFVNIMQEYGDETGLLTADERFVKLWNTRQSSNFAAFESQGKINGICHYPKSGLVFVAQDDRKIGTFYVDCLGLAPRWAAFLDNIVDEMEEANSGAMFDNFEFVTFDDLDRQGIDFDEVKGSLRPHTHGFLIPRKLYRSLREKAGVIKEVHTLSRKLDRILDAREMRPRVPVKTIVSDPTVNKDLKEALEKRKNQGKKHGKAAAGVLEDDRFKELFVNSDFAVERV